MMSNNPFGGINPRPDLPLYPAPLQLIRVTAATVPGPAGFPQFTGSSVLGPIVYVAFTQQLRTDAMLPRDREPCLVDDVRGLGLVPGFYLGRLTNNWNSLPLYEVIGDGRGSQGPPGPSGGTVEVKALDGSPDYLNISVITVAQLTGLDVTQSGFGIADLAILAASISQMGAVTTGTQSFAGNKTFTNNVKVDGNFHGYLNGFGVTSTAGVFSNFANGDWGTSGEYRLGSEAGSDATRGFIEYITGSLSPFVSRLQLRVLNGNTPSEYFTATLSNDEFVLGGYQYTAGGAPVLATYLPMKFSVRRETYSGSGSVAKYQGQDVTGNTGASTSWHFAGGLYVGNGITPGMLVGTDAVYRGSGGSITPPTTSTSSGIQGQLCFDGSYFYLCTGTNTWVRVPWDLTPW